MTSVGEAVAAFGGACISSLEMASGAVRPVSLSPPCTSPVEMDIVIREVVCTTRRVAGEVVLFENRKVGAGVVSSAPAARWWLEPAM